MKSNNQLSYRLISPTMVCCCCELRSCIHIQTGGVVPAPRPRAGTIAQFCHHKPSCTRTLHLKPLVVASSPLITDGTLYLVASPPLSSLGCCFVPSSIYVCTTEPNGHGLEVGAGVPAHGFLVDVLYHRAALVQDLV